MSEVNFDHVSKVYDEEILAVDDVDFRIEDGEFTTIVGPSGSGKSTLLRMVAGLEDITEGTVEIGRREINDVQPQDRGVAMVFQNYALYPHMSVRQNMSYGLKQTTSLSDDEIDGRVVEAAEMMGIEGLLDQKPAQLSGGQQQRVATGRAIVREPEVFLFDEPLSNLDAKLRLHMRTELQRIQEDLDTTTMYVTHDQEEALTMSDRVVILNHGEIQQIGAPDEIYHRPANQFVADFIGSPSMNFFDVQLDGTVLSGGAFDYPLSRELAERIRERMTGETGVLGIRPENMRIGEEGDQSVRATVDVVEPVGSDNYLYVLVGDEECTVRVSADVKPTESEHLSITFDEEDVHLFDGQTEENVLVEGRSRVAADSQPSRA
ncbi:ABC transporter ATP-binding protein [Candidatus Halobonum tyrrellensis]|uniref:ABC-type D-xylose/L-arabinose transporter n=1 Tax=Candidatus Halobonum tyrrellensis G22 TaxID=1324957 RepID=V4GX57_9EURY|nr:sn-glycerol-3-phosphate ABC transporter ATP-binding protein UgpC [Candidatus Halobonum tyrrellensis]ESP89756.1 ABC transporter [Candidatus Halobonum tyrrellensis G22]